MAWGGGSTGSTTAVQKPWLKKPTPPSWVKSQQRWQPRWQPLSRLVREPRTPLPAPADFQLDREARYSGTVVAYWKWKGYGFVKPDQSGLVPGDWLFVHWSNIQSDDRYPCLMKGMPVEFGIMKWRDKKNMTTLRAKYVTAPGGGMIAILDQLDTQSKTFVGGQHLRYRGTIKFYSPKGRYGYVVLDDGYELSEPVPKELRVEESEVNAAGKRVTRWLENLRVEFGICKTKKGTYEV
ncbi:unnamed protein product, partial [Polarella glacialis]